MTKVVVLLAEGFEEVEALTVVDVLRRCDVEVDVVGVNSEVVVGAHGIRVVSDKQVNDIVVEDYDAFILPGGSPGYVNLRGDSRVLSLVKKAFEKNRVVAAICAAPAVLADAGVLEGKKATIYPGMEDEIEKVGAQVEEGLVVQDGNVVTSRGPATALLFALKLASIFVGEEKAKDVGRRMLVDLVVSSEFLFL
ncbi:MAG TPA: DJ-1/PfpI family protein [Thermoplasmatales archaeon]|nr:DJ-1/PfpI family protein [Thermoplasmatales archaeon]